MGGTHRSAVGVRGRWPQQKDSCKVSAFHLKSSCPWGNIVELWGTQISCLWCLKVHFLFKLHYVLLTKKQQIFNRIYFCTHQVENSPTLCSLAALDMVLKKVLLHLCYLIYDVVSELMGSGGRRFHIASKVMCNPVSVEFPNDLFWLPTPNMLLFVTAYRWRY